MDNFDNQLQPNDTKPQTLQEKIALVEEMLTIEYTEEERRCFDQWLTQLAENSIKKPIAVTDIDKITSFLPEVPNYKDERINLFFTKEELVPNELQSILEKFSKANPSFEISLVKHDDSVISIGIGKKLRNGSTIFSGEYFGHYHPTQIEIEDKENLPHCFVAGLMPSAGDVKGFLKHFESVKKGTRIFSKNGYVVIKPTLEAEDFSQAIDAFNEKYFDLFLGVNKFGFKSDDAVIQYFKVAFGFALEFHYFNQENKDDNEIE